MFNFFLLKIYCSGVFSWSYSVLLLKFRGSAQWDTSSSCYVC